MAPNRARTSSNIRVLFKFSSKVVCGFPDSIDRVMSRARRAIVTVTQCLVPKIRSTQEVPFVPEGVLARLVLVFGGFLIGLR